MGLCKKTFPKFGIAFLVCFFDLAEFLLAARSNAIFEPCHAAALGL